MYTTTFELALEARCEIAMARINGPLNCQLAFEHARRAREGAYSVGLFDASEPAPPLLFVDSPTLVEGWKAGKRARASAAYPDPLASANCL